MDKCKICHGDIAFRICKKCHKLVCKSCYLKDLGVCIECGPQMMK